MDGSVDENSELRPLLLKRLHEPRTVFTPGMRIRMNIIPILLNLFVPWATFILCCGLTSFWLLYKEPQLVLSLLCLVYLCWVITILAAFAARKAEAEPTWFTYVAIVIGIAAIVGTFCGVNNFETYSRPYYEIHDLKVVREVDAGRELGQNLMDAGILFFDSTSGLDATRSWHFKQGKVYCVAPVIVNSTGPVTLSYDFWAVGVDCCSTQISDFRCGADWSNLSAHSGIRVLDDDAVKNFRLAVKQAETLYGIVSTHPIFFTWSHDPIAEINGWREQAFKNFVFLICLAFALLLFGILVATCRYAMIGRAASAYAMDFYGDPEWAKANTGHTPAMRTRPFAVM